MYVSVWAAVHLYVSVWAAVHLNVSVWAAERLYDFVVQPESRYERSVRAAKALDWNKNVISKNYPVLQKYTQNILMFYPWAMFFPIIIKLNGMKNTLRP